MNDIEDYDPQSLYFNQCGRWEKAKAWCAKFNEDKPKRKPGKRRDPQARAEYMREYLRDYMRQKRRKQGIDAAE